MTGDTTTVGADEHGERGAAAAASVERRPSIVKLQNMLRKVSQSPFHNQYKTLVSSTSDFSESSANEYQNKQNGEQEVLHLSPQSGISGGLERMNSSHAHSLDLGSKGHVMKDVRRKMSDENLNTILVPPPEFQNVENGAQVSEPQKDLFQAHNANHSQGLFQASTLARKTSANDPFHDVTLNSPDLFKSIPAQTQTFPKTLDLFKDEGVNLFQAAKGDDEAKRTTEVNLFDKSPSIFVDPFISTSNKEYDLFRSPQPKMANPFSTTTTNGADLFQSLPTRSGELFNIRENKQDASTKEDPFGMSFKENLDVFSSSSTNSVDPFPSPITKSLFQSVSSLDDPFGPTPSKQYDPFQDVSNGSPFDIFQPLPSKTNSNVFEINPINTASTPSLNSQKSEVKLDMLSSPDLFKAATSESHPAIQPNSSDRPHDIVLTTPQGTEHEILEPSPFSRARHLSVSPRQSPSEMTHVQTFKRPPKPLPRTRPPRPNRPPKPEKPLTPANPIGTEPALPKTSPKPAFSMLPKPVKPKTLESKQTDPENYVVFEDVLLIGQERCVEDWPEDSPELNPDFKPSGTLRLRRESLKMNSNGGSGEDQDNSGSHSKKKDKKNRKSFLSRRGSKEKFADDTKEGRSKTLPYHSKSTMEYSDRHMSAGENEDEEQNGMVYTKNPLKTKVNPKLRRASTNSSVPDTKHMNKLLPQESKGDDDKKSVSKKNSIERRWSEGVVLDGSTGEDEEGDEAQHGEKKKKKVKITFIPHRGFAITSAKTDDKLKGAHGYTSRKNSKVHEYSDRHMSAGENEDEEQNGMVYTKDPLKTKVNLKLRRASTNSSVPDTKHMNKLLPQESKDDDDKKSAGKKNFTERRWSETDDKLKGAHGYTPRKNSNVHDKSQDEVLGAHGYTPQYMSQANPFEDVDEMKDYRLQSAYMADFMDDDLLQKTPHMSAGLNGDEDPYGMADWKPKKPTKMKQLLVGRRSSKEGMLDNSPQTKNSFSAEELDNEDLKGMQDCKPKNSKYKVPIPIPRNSKTTSGQSEPIGFSQHIPQQASMFNQDAFADNDIPQTGTYFMSPGEMYDSEQDEVETCKPKKSSKLKGLKKQKAKNKAMHLECEDPPGATSSDYLSEAAKAEWLAAQMDERAIAALEDDDQEGDTDSLMEWWNTVEQWDEVPSDDEDKFKTEDESKSFSILADKVHRGLRVFNKVFTERAEVLWQSTVALHSIADNINNFHHKAKIAGITGGTTTAVGGVTAIAGLALAPFTLGASLIVTAVGVGVATAGGIASASAAISDNVNNMNDRKKVEMVLENYEAQLLDIGKILHFVNQGLYKLRGHPFLRSGTQHYSEDWEVRRAVQMISFVDQPVMRATEIADEAITSVQGLFKGMDKYFIKDSRELKKGCKKEVVGQIKHVANFLHDGVVELNAIREELQDATGNI
ncbi:uncharacterized protein si:cabz01007807.1 isoform X5 [Micropterus salmoides]|uniref:uncharacterized protein si:cabz01007807.1 isoform X5 n=1 Tax=Micropterus salmoides TaxID=27706 RepID=UPI0018EA3503|nr:uncharacterized protein si:cabz01007807.1 isoform X5 [Micropterus salmoides]